MDLYSFFYETVIDPIVDRNTRALKSMEFRQPPDFQMIGKAVFGDIIDPDNGDLYSLELKKIRKKGYTPEPPVAYEGFGEHEGEYVPAEYALHYAMKQCGIEPIKKYSPEYSPEQQEFAEMLVEWYFSGSWRAIREGDSEHGEG